MTYLEQFSYRNVHLEDSVLSRQRQNGFIYYFNIPNDSLLKSYRKRAHQYAPGEDMGGWYDFPQSPAGHLIGHVISGLARWYQNCENPEILSKINELVHEFGKTVDIDGYFYNYSWNDGKPLDYYVYDKIAIGLLDAYRYAQNREALTILSKITDWVINHTALEKLDLEWYTLPENLYECYDVTGDEKYKNLAEKLTYETWYDALSREINVLPGKHAYSHVNALCSAAKIYLETKNEKYLRAIKNAYGMIIREQLYASGGYGPGEAFVEPGSDSLREALHRSGKYNKFNTNKHNEAPCNSYALTKLSRYLLCLTGDTFLGDVMERVIFNAFLGTLRPVGKGITHYYDTYRPGGLKTYFTEQNNQTWPCCAGTYFQMLADYPLDIYFWTENRIYVNLFINSSVKWAGKYSEIRMGQSTDFPEGDKVKFHMEMEYPEQFCFCFRIPGWAASEINVSINGEAVRRARQPGSCYEIFREWKNGDIIDIVIPKRLYTEKINNLSPDVCALMYGPVLLVGETISDALPYSQEEFIDSLIPVPGRSITFTTTGLNPNVTFRPYYSIQNQITPYTTYFKCSQSTPDPVLIDDIHTHWIYDSEWKKEYKRKFDEEVYLNDFIHYTSSDGAEARIQFQGTALKLTASRSPSHGRMKLKVDGYPEEEINLNSKQSRQRECVWIKTGLPEGEHTLVVTAVISEEEQKNGIIAEIDALEIIPLPVNRNNGVQN